MKKVYGRAVMTHGIIARPLIRTEKTKYYGNQEEYKWLYPRSKF